MGRWCIRELQRRLGPWDLGQMLLRPCIVNFPPSKHPVHLAQRPNCVSDEIRTAIAFMSRNQLMLTLDPEALGENLLFPTSTVFFAAIAVSVMP